MQRPSAGGVPGTLEEQSRGWVEQMEPKGPEMIPER